MPATHQTAVLSLAIVLALIAQPGCEQNQPESVTKIDRTPETETVRRVEETQGNEPDRTPDQTPGTDSDSAALAESRFGRGEMLMAAGAPIDVAVGHLVPCVTDWNSDGKKDLVVGQFSSGAIRLYLNQGTDAEPVFEGFSMLHADGRPIRLDAG